MSIFDDLLRQQAEEQVKDLHAEVHREVSDTLRKYSIRSKAVIGELEKEMQRERETRIKGTESWIAKHLVEIGSKEKQAIVPPRHTTSSPLFSMDKEID